MSTQPEALQIIQHMDDEYPEDWDGRRIRAELRRLHEANQELLGVLKDVVWDADDCGCEPDDKWCPLRHAEKLIAKHGEQK
jgi:hypothetical protein